MKITLPELSAEMLQQSTDEYLGTWLVATWTVFQAEKAGIPTDAIPRDWAEQCTETSAKMDSASIGNATLESMFRKAFSGNFTTAGRMLREYYAARAHAALLAKYAPAGIKQAAGRKKAGMKSGALKKETANAVHKKWVSDAQKLVASGKDPRNLTSIIAERTGATSSAIRPVLQAAGIVPKKKRK